MPTRPSDPNDLSPRDITDLAWTRLTEWFIHDVRVYRIGDQDYLDWKTRILRADKLYRGEYTLSSPDERRKYDYPHTQNFVEVTSSDLRRMVSETEPDIYCPPLDESSDAQKDARLREAILRTFWEAGRGRTIEPWLVLDLALTGTAFLGCIPPGSCEGYPYPFRIDPRGAYPDVMNGQLQDLMVIQRLRKRQAIRMLQPFVQTDLMTWAGDRDDIEIIDYYHAKGIVRVATCIVNNEPVGDPLTIQRIKTDLDCPPVGFAMLPSADGFFRGMFDQVEGILTTKNDIFNLMLDYADSAIYAPWQEYGMQNAEDRPGPNTIYRGVDPQAFIKRVEPAVSSPQIWQMLEQLETEARGGLAYPQARQGEVPQSIASGSFVNSTQGQLTSVVREMQRLLADLRQQFNYVALAMDEKIPEILASYNPNIDPNEKVQKKLLFPIEGKHLYTPKKAIAGMHMNSVTYGAGAGLDYVNRRTSIEQAVGSGLLSKDTGRGQLGDVQDPGNEGLKVQRENLADAIMAKGVSPENLSTLLQIAAAMATGKDFVDAAQVVMEQQQQQAPQAQPNAGMPAQASQGAPAASPSAAPAEAPENLGEAGPGVPFTPANPLTNILVRGGEGG